MLELYRRHTENCTHKADGKKWIKCSCPIWCDGWVEGKRIRASLGTGDWSRATRKLAAEERKGERGEAEEKKEKRYLVSTAVEQYLSESSARELTSKRTYGIWLNTWVTYAESAGLKYLDQWRVEDVGRYKTHREGKISPSALRGALVMMRAVFRWAQTRNWVKTNPAKHVALPTQMNYKEVIPFTKDEMARIIAATEGSSYNMRRARAMVLLMRFYALRISDVAAFKKSDVSDMGVFVRAQKNGAPLWMPLYPFMREALEALPVPIHGKEDGPYYFWNQIGAPLDHKRNVAKTLQQVFKRAGVPNAHPHKFRHTLATDMLASGAGMQDVADVLGDTLATVERHYAKWNPARQARIVALLNAVHFPEAGSGSKPAENVPLVQNWYTDKW